MSLTVTIGGVSITGDAHKVTRNTFALTNAIGQRDTLACSITSADASFRPPVGAPVVVEHSDLGTLFGGTIRRTQTALIGNAITTAIQCASWEQLFDRRLCGAVTYTNQAAGDIFQDIFTRYMGGEGLTASIVATGPVIASVAFDFCTVREAFDTICQLASDSANTYMWDCTPGKVTRLYSQASFPAPIDVTEDRSDIFRDINVTRTFDGYANRVFVRLGKYITDERTNTYHPDGTERTFSFEIPLAAAPTITLDGVIQTVGVKDKDTGKQWYWQDGSSEVTQDPGETIPSNTSELIVAARGYQSTVIDGGQNDDEVAERSTVEGSSGWYMTLIESSDPGTSIDAVGLATAWLDRFSRIPYAVEYRTSYGGIKAGMSQRIALTKFGAAFDSTFIVESAALVQENNIWLWKIRAVNGALANNWLKKLRDMNRAGGASGNGTAVSGGSSSGGGQSAVALYADGTLGIQADACPAMYLKSTGRPSAVKAYVKQAPTGADLSFTIYVGADAWLSLTIAAGATSVAATNTALDAAGVIGADTDIRLGITAVGSSFPGSDLAVFIYF